MPKPTENLAGREFGRLQVISFAGYRNIGKKRPIAQASWLCSCKCGTEKIIMASGLLTGGSQSCGCRQKDLARELGRQHAICQAKNSGSIAARQLFSRYKGDEKKRSLEFDLPFEVAMRLFVDDCHYCGQKPSRVNYIARSKSAFTYNGIDRVDNTKGYSTDNCVTCCLKCNECKRAQSYNEFLEWVATVHNRLCRVS